MPVESDEQTATQFPPHVLREYALLADGERGIVIGPRGDCVWMCLPRWHSPAVFNTLLGGSGVYAVAPAWARFVWGGRYEARSLIWRSRWVTTDGVVECREALAFPGDIHTAVVLRRIRALDQTTRMRVDLNVRTGCGVREMTDLVCTGGVWSGRSGPCRLRWSGAPGARPDEQGRLTAFIDVEPGNDHDLVLEISDRELDADPVDADRAWESTRRAWEQAVPSADGTLADADCEHAYAVLRGLTSRGGGMVAAATTSLPERAEQGRNYDYRYCWIRDQCYTGQALASAGPSALLDDAVAFVAERVLADGPQLRPAYTVSGDDVPDEKNLDLPGYPGAEVRRGNWVRSQFQLDAYGEALLLLAAAARLDRLDRTHWEAAGILVRAITDRWAEPDAGVWELDNRRWAHSRLMCAAGLRRIAEVAPGKRAASWNELADKIVRSATADCVHPSGRWQRAPDDPRLDAALLLPGIRGAVPGDDPRSRATVEAVRRELAEQGYVFRYKPDERDLGEAEGAFLLCGFFMALADHQQGNELAAVRWFERNRTACGPPGLFTEEFDVDQRQLRGNLPQAFVHALMFEAAHRLAEAAPPPR
ncbi:glycoside hydrolase family 15 protein [Speluncibacter jeojiensis]|uniref:Glycoside hydrolase family 15 protein n=1 Tax=Speluncibacter jeojiensis TaxID=2710754 RepID=A0A9X4M3P5_9ACTN|nr:glycoside hydrolase family 15 protein [Corynebacteriales bacterium D3-21]